MAAALAAALLPVPAAWVERFYARGWFPPVQRALTAASNAVPFALLDALILAAVGVAAAALVSVLRAPRGRRLAAIGRRAWQAAVARRGDLPGVPRHLGRELPAVSADRRCSISTRGASRRPPSSR